VPAAATVPALLADLLRADPGRPAVTWIDPPSGARVELSRATLANWVAKIGGLLQDVAEVQAAERIGLDLPTHWLSVAWPLACWSVGGVVLPAGSGSTADVPVVADTGVVVPADRLVVVGLAPLGGRSRVPVPAGGLDAGAEVLGQPDDLVAYDPPGPASAATEDHDHGGLLVAARRRAEALGLGAGARLATDTGPCTPDGLVDTVLAPLVVGGSLVLLTTRDPAALTAERPDVRAGSLAG